MSRTFLTLTLLLLASTPLRAAECAVDTLAWMTGSWSATRGDVHEEEHWMAPGGGVMVGMNRIVRAGRLRGFDFYRIEQRADGVYYVSSPNGAPPTLFKLKECGPARVVFEKLDHDFPQRILYRRDHPDTLHARIEGVVKGTLRSAEWTWTRGSLQF